MTRAIAAAAAALLLMAAAPAPKAPPRNETAVRAAILQVLMLQGIKPGVVMAFGDAVYQVDALEVAFAPDGSPTIAVKLKLLR